MKNLRVYGKAPFNLAVVHGGPGAAGEMAPVAKRIALSGRGVLEPLQTATSLAGQVEELKNILAKSGNLPVTLIGFSWGAWLSYIVAASYPVLVKKLILVGSGPFEEKYAAILQATRLSRLSEQERTELKHILAMPGETAREKNASLSRLGALCAKTDSYDPLEYEANEDDMAGCDGTIFENVWKDAAELRKKGKLLELAGYVQCPVVAIHGDYDPHPAQGVEKPLSATLKSFRFILLKNCGHMPWVEREARGRFFEVLEEELG